VIARIVALGLLAAIIVVVLVLVLAIGGGGGRVAPQSRQVVTSPGGTPANATPPRASEGVVAGGVLPGAGPGRGGRLAAVTMRRIAFAPEVIHVRRGDAVRFTNRDHVDHTVTADENLNSSQAGPFGSGQLPPGASFTARFSRPGTYPYVCYIHPTMTGRVVVG